MASGQSDGLLESEDPDATVARLLSQFHSSTTRQTAPSAPRVEEEIQDVSAFEFSQIMQQHPSFEIPVPMVENPSDYEYLPGHFAARRILSIDLTDPRQPMYTVRLRSGEQETVWHIQLVLTLEVLVV